MFVDSCIEYNIDYEGNDVKGIDGVKSRMDCQAHCQTNNNCKGWTWGVTSHHCGLKSSDSKRTTYLGVISGPKVCQQCDVKGKCLVSINFHKNDSFEP